MFTTILFIAAGFALLYFGAEFLVRGSSQIALRFGVSPLVVGLTVVAFGTSAPELVVSITSVFNGSGDVAIGNVVGSNIFNIAVILGLSALINPVRVNRQVLRMDMPIMVTISFVVIFLLRDKTIDRLEGLALFTGILLYVGGTIWFARKGNVSPERGGEVRMKPGESLLLYIVLVLAGLAFLVIGSRLFVKGAVDLARILNVSEAVIGLTIVAMGTSLPELATSVVAACRKEDDIAVGNIVGSNIFNMLSILGATGLLMPVHGQGITVVDLLFMAGSAVVLLPLMISGLRINRFEGLLLLAIYAGYLCMLWPK